MSDYSATGLTQHLLTLLLGGRPVKPHQPPESAAATVIPDGAGLNTCASLARLSPDGLWQKILEELPLFATVMEPAPLEEYLLPYPRWGIACHGELGALRTWERRTDASVSSSWGDVWTTQPTAMASMYRDDAAALEARGADAWDTLPIQVTREEQNWATPKSSCTDMDTMERQSLSGTERKEMKKQGHPYQTKTTGSLHPSWVASLQGLPPTYLDLDGTCTREDALAWVRDPRWPARPHQLQHGWECPRLGSGIKDRIKKLRALGNAVVPPQALPIFQAIRDSDAAAQNKGAL